MMRVRIEVVLVLLFCFLPPAVAFGESSSFLFSAENDAFFSGTDDKFSNGLYVSLSQDGLLRPFSDWLFDGLGGQIKHSQTSLTFAQNIYTPTDTQRTDVILDDRPYAAWNYVSVRQSAIFAWPYKLTAAASVDLGLLGDGLGSFVQNGWHQYVLNIPTLKGWANHIDDRLAIQANLSSTLPILSWAPPFFDSPVDSSRPRFEVLSNTALEVGNVFVRASTGGSMRIGYFPEYSPFDTTTQIPKEIKSPFDQARHRANDFLIYNLDVSVYGSIMAHLTGYNGTLDLGGGRYFVKWAPLSFDAFGGLKVAVPVSILEPAGGGGYLSSNTLVTLDISPWFFQTADFTGSGAVVSEKFTWGFHRFGRYSVMLTSVY